MTWPRGRRHLCQWAQTRDQGARDLLFWRSPPAHAWYTQMTQERVTDDSDWAGTSIQWEDVISGQSRRPKYGQPQAAEPPFGFNTVKQCWRLPLSIHRGCFSDVWMLTHIRPTVENWTTVLLLYVGAVLENPCMIGPIKCGKWCAWLTEIALYAQVYYSDCYKEGWPHFSSRTKEKISQSEYTAVYGHIIIPAGWNATCPCIYKNKWHEWINKVKVICTKTH